MKHTLTSNTLKNEAAILTSYLLGEKGTDQSTMLYERALTKNDYPVSEKDQQLIAFIKKYPRTLHAIDSYHALRKPESELRRRLFVMFSILETQPEYADLYLPDQKSHFHIIALILSMLGGLLLIPAGFVFHRLGTR